MFRICTLSLLLLASTMGTATADEAPRILARNIMQRVAHLQERLNITLEQKAEAAAVLKAHRDRMAPAVDAVLAARLALAAEVHSGVVDEAAIRARAGELATAQADLAVARAELHAALRALLDSEQQQAIDDARERFRRRVPVAVGVVRGLIDGWIAAHEG